MSNPRADDETALFSALFPAGRLFPASRRGELQLTEHSQPRKIPDFYRPSSMSDQSRGTLEQQRTTHFDDEMLAVQRNYTACIGDQGVPPSAQEMYRLVAKMAADAMSRSNEHPGVSVQKANAVRCMDRYIRETTLDLNRARRDLSRRADDNRVFRFHAQLGDYAGALCDALKEHVDKQSPTVLSRPWTMIVEAIDKYEKELAAWKASGKRKTRPHSDYIVAIKARLRRLVELGFTDLDIDLALFAIKAYARRNYIAHGRAFDIFKGDRFAELAEYIDQDDKTLEGVLPDGELPMAGKWRRLLTFYRDTHIRRGEGGDWQRQIPLKDRLESLPPGPARPWGAVLRSEFEMGKFRPTGLDGPPPTNVSWDPRSYRHRSELVNRGVKRPATEQPPEPPRVKRARVANYTDKTLGTIRHNITDSDAYGNQRSQLKLHDLIARLAQHSPSDAAQLLKDETKRVQGELEKLRKEIADLELKRAGKERKSQSRSEEKGRSILDNSDEEDVGGLGVMGPFER